ncbi:MAG: Ig-like domain-containing protein [Treponema sp.]
MKRKAFVCSLIFSILVLLCGLSFSCSDFLNDYYDLTPELLSLSITGENSVYAGYTITLSANASPKGTDSAVTWSSSNKSIAIVDSTGKVTGVGAGSATITATSTSDSSISSSTTVNVNANSYTVSLSGNSYVSLGRTITLTATVTDILDNSVSIDSDDLEWSSRNKSIATVDDDGVVTGVASGSATIYVEYSNNGAVATATKSITVY